MTPIYTFHDTSITIQIIEKGCYYKANIPNNEANKKLIENTIFKFDNCDSGIIMHDDIHVFQLSKMECKYSDYIEIKRQLGHFKKQFVDTKKDNDLLNSKLTDKEELQQQFNIYYEEQTAQLKQSLSNNNDLLQQQIKETDNLKNELNNIKTLLHQQIKLFNNKSIEYNKNIYYLPFVFKMRGMGNFDSTYYGNEQIVLFDRNNDYDLTGIINFFRNKKDVHKLLTTELSHLSIGSIYHRIIIPPGKVIIMISFRENSLKVYNKGIYCETKLDNVCMLINEKNRDNIINLCKKKEWSQIFGNLIITQIESECLKE